MRTAILRTISLAPILLAACTTSRDVPPNPPAAGFDFEHSDPRAIAVADEVMAALGGRDAWDATRCLEWTFANRRKLLWDKYTGDFRLDKDGATVLMDLDTGNGRFFENGVEVVNDPDRVRKELDAAYRIWVNDSYWLVAPYKLLDSGVRLTYAGERPLPDGRPADVLHLEFAGVGVTPDNAYELWIARDTHLLEQWSYFKHRDDTKPAMTTPWNDWKRYGRIRLATDHGKGPSTTDIAVYDDPPARLRAP